MNDSLILYDQSLSETRDESISRQFYDWERRGRGWQVYDFPVDLEPPFRPFYFFEPKDDPATDDGRISTFFSRLFDGGSGKLNNGNALVQKKSELRKYEEYIAEADEPEFCGYYQQDFEEIRLVLPNDLKVSKSVSEQLLLSLSYSSHPISFEVIGNAEQISIQFAATKDDASQLRQQLEAHLHGCSFLTVTSDDNHSDSWLNGGDCPVIVDFGLSEEFMLPLSPIQNFETDPLIAIVGAMSNLKQNETAVLQVLLQKAKSDWPKEVIETIGCFEGTGFFDYLPDIKSLAKQKFGSPLFAVVIRVAAKSSYDDRSMQILRNMGGGLAQLAKPSANELIPLSNDGYDFEYHEQALLNRQSFRCGMLLNSEELVSLVHPPSQSLQSSKLVRQSEKTKASPNVALGQTLVLGKNVHQDQVREVTLSSDQRTRHIHVIGSSGSGKSTLLLNLIKQDMENGEGLCVIDPHGDLIDDVIANVPESRTSDVILFDPSDSEYPIGFNILQAKTELEKTILSSDLVATFRRMSTSWGDVMDSVLANAILAIIESTNGGTLLDLKRFLIEKKFRDEFLKTVSDDSIHYFWTHEFPMIASKPQASILIRLDTFLRQKLVRNIVCQKETKLNFREIMDNKKILLIKLSQGLIGEENSHLLGTLLVSKIYQTALSRQESQNRPHFWLYLDEFQHFITPSMENILSGSRKYNLGLTLSHQEFRQLQSRNQDVASSVLSNCYTRICFRPGDADAEKFANGFSFFDSKALQNLGIGQAIARIERSEHDFNLQVPHVPKIAQELADRRKADIIASSRLQFGTPKLEIENSLAFPKDSAEVPSKPQTQKTKINEQSSNLKQVVETPPTVAFSPLPETTDAESNKPQHRYLQSLIKRLGENKGFRGLVEHTVLEGLGKIDVVLEDGEIKIACEVSVTNDPSYEVQNILKCITANYSPIVLISPDARHLNLIKTLAQESLSKEHLAIVNFLSPDEFIKWLEELRPDVDETVENIKGFKVKVGVKSADSSDQSTRKRAISDVVFGALKRLKNKN